MKIKRNSPIEDWVGSLEFVAILMKSSIGIGGANFFKRKKSYLALLPEIMPQIGLKNSILFVNRINGLMVPCFYRW